MMFSLFSRELRSVEGRREGGPKERELYLLRSCVNLFGDLFVVITFIKFHYLHQHKTVLQVFPRHIELLTIDQIVSCMVERFFRFMVNVMCFMWFHILHQ